MNYKGKGPATGPSQVGGQTIPTPRPEDFPPANDKVEYDVIANLKRLPSKLSIYETLLLFGEAREALVSALVNQSVRERCLEEHARSMAVECDATITFTDDDLMLGDKQHNRPLFVSGDLAGEYVNRIMLDAGSAVNILPLKTLRKIGYTPAQLRDSSLLIQGFHQGGGDRYHHA